MARPPRGDRRPATGERRSDSPGSETVPTRGTEPHEDAEAGAPPAGAGGVLGGGVHGITGGDDREHRVPESARGVPAQRIERPVLGDQRLNGYGMVFAAAQIPAGRPVDRWGRRLSLAGVTDRGRAPGPDAARTASPARPRVTRSSAPAGSILGDRGAQA